MPAPLPALVVWLLRRLAPPRLGDGVVDDLRDDYAHVTVERPGWPDVLFAYHDRVTLGPSGAMRVLARKTGLTPGDL